MKSMERRIIKLEEKVENSAREDITLDVLALEQMCSEGQVQQAAELLAQYLERRVATCKDLPDPETWILMTDDCLRNISEETLIKIRDYCRKLSGRVCDPNVVSKTPKSESERKQRGEPKKKA
jgi:hypothetical protein